MIGYEVDEFTHSWLAEWFIVSSPIYPGFMGQVSTLTQFPLEPGCQDYSYLDQAGKDFEHGLDSILLDSVNTPELVASFNKTDAVPSSGFLCWWVAILINLDCSLLLVSVLINYGTRLELYFYLYHKWLECQFLSRFFIFPVIQQHLDSRCLCHLITSLWCSLWFFDWHWCSSSCHFWHRASYSKTRAAFVDTVTSLQILMED